MFGLFKRQETSLEATGLLGTSASADAAAVWKTVLADAQAKAPQPSRESLQGLDLPVLQRELRPVHALIYNARMANLPAPQILCLLKLVFYPDPIIAGINKLAGLGAKALYDSVPVVVLKCILNIMLQLTFRFISLALINNLVLLNALNLSFYFVCDLAFARYFVYQLRCRQDAEKNNTCLLDAGNKLAEDNVMGAAEMLYPLTQSDSNCYISFPARVRKVKALFDTVSSAKVQAWALYLEKLWQALEAISRPAEIVSMRVEGDDLGAGIKMSRA